MNENKVVNPFSELEPELVTLSTGEVMDPVIANCLRDAKMIGATSYDEFVRDRIEKAVKPLSDTIPKVNLYTFQNRPPADLHKAPSMLSAAKFDSSLITRFYLSLQARPESDQDDFFKHENFRDPPSL